MQNIELNKTDSISIFADKNAPRKFNFAAEKFAKDKYICGHLYLEKKNALFVADSEGMVHMWKPKYDFKSELVRSAFKAHLGPIFKFMYLKDSSLLLSGSADRTLKLWDVWDREKSGAQCCVQTLVGHGGTVLDIAYHQGMLVSCSTDKTIRVWMSDSNRGIMLYPYYICVQVLTLPSSAPCTVVCMASSSLLSAVFIGDSEGKLHAMDKRQMDQRDLEEEKMEVLFPSPTRPPQKVHDLSVSHMYIAQAESYLCSLSFDHTALIHEANSGNGVFGIENPSRCRYSGFAWNPVNKELFLIDIKGTLQVWNCHTGACLATIKVCDGPLKSISCDNSSRLTICTAVSLSIYS
jgi:WD40 repeat protein